MVRQYGGTMRYTKDGWNNREPLSASLAFKFDKERIAGASPATATTDWLHNECNPQVEPG